MQKLLIAAFALSLCTPLAQAFTVYKSIGAHGEVRYTQAPPQDATNVEVIEFRNDGRVNTAGEYAPQANAGTPDNNNAELQRQIAEAEARETAERCRILRNNLASLNIGGPIYDIGPSGERSYLDPQEIASRRERIQQAINQFCK